MFSKPNSSHTRKERRERDKKRDEGNPQSWWVIGDCHCFVSKIRICFCQKRKSANNESAKCQCAALCQSSTIQQSLTTSIGTLTILHILIYLNIFFFPMFFLLFVGCMLQRASKARSRCCADTWCWPLDFTRSSPQSHLASTFYIILHFEVRSFEA